MGGIVKKTFFSSIFIFVVYILFAANVSVDNLDIISLGSFDTKSDKFNMNTYLNFKTSLDGGYKFAANVAFETVTSELASNYKLNNLGLGAVYLFFNSAAVTARNLADSHIDLTFWTGSYRYLGDGNIYKGYIYFPQSVNDKYDGFYRLRGTGLSATFKLLEEKLKFSTHIYNNTNFIQPTDTVTKLNYFSADIEAGLYFEYVYFELFGGYTKDIKYPNDQSEIWSGRVKAGITFWVGNEHVEFYSTCGIPDIDAYRVADFNSGKSNLFDSLYLLAELRFNLFKANNVISFLTRPALYNETPTGYKSDFDINYKLIISSPNHPLSGGIIANFSYYTNDKDETDWNLILSPYLSILLSGVNWNINVGYDFASIGDASSTGDQITALEGLKIVLGVSTSY